MPPIEIRFLYDVAYRASKTGQEGEICHLLTALRGPDIWHDENRFMASESQRLKLLTTGRIRHICGFPYGATFEKPLTDSQIQERDKLLDKFTSIYGNHFKCHIIGALRVLDKMGYDVPQKELFK